MVHVALYKLISFFNNENIVSACPDFGFALEIDILLDQFLISCLSIPQQHSHVRLFALLLLTHLFYFKKVLPIMILLVELFNSCLPKQKCRPFPLHINN
jgi:hypothetical protein